MFTDKRLLSLHAVDHMSNTEDYLEAEEVIQLADVPVVHKVHGVHLRGRTVRLNRGRFCHRLP